MYGHKVDSFTWIDGWLLPSVNAKKFVEFDGFPDTICAYEMDAGGTFKSHSICVVDFEKFPGTNSGASTQFNNKCDDEFMEFDSVVVSVTSEFVPMDELKFIFCGVEWFIKSFTDKLTGVCAKRQFEPKRQPPLLKYRHKIVDASRFVRVEMFGSEKKKISKNRQL